MESILKYKARIYYNNGETEVIDLDATVYYEAKKEVEKRFFDDYRIIAFRLM